MKKTSEFNSENSILINTGELRSLLRCGRHTAVKIGDLAKARVQINNRVLWNRSKIEDYVSSIAC